MKKTILAGLVGAAFTAPAFALDLQRASLDDLIAQHAKANNVPESLVHRVIVRESRYNPRAIGRGGTMGLMQIKHGTARALGYAGPAKGLLEADTNLTYAVRYLAGAYRVANGDHKRAVSYYARGYYYDAKRKGIALKRGAPEPEVAPPVAATAALPPQPPLIAAISSMFNTTPVAAADQSLR